MLNVVDRDLNEKTKLIRARGYIPAIIYTSKSEKNIPISIYKTDFIRMVDVKENTGIIELNLNGDVKKCTLGEVQIDGVKDIFLHVDFVMVD